MRDMNSNRRTELAGFLRARRARLSPRQAGLPEAGTPNRRRTPGLRRQEVAQLAGLSVDYYIRLEQARGPHPSRQVLAALARALMLTADRYPGDPGIDSLVTELLALSPRFAGMWAEHEVEVRGPMLKHVDHPLAGPLEFECQVLHIAETGQRIIAYCAAPGSATEAFAELAHRAPIPG
jgi:transcriptional regulator with XRE-family HTH domain